MNSTPDIFREELVNGSRRALAKAITLVESTNQDHRAQADALLESLPTPAEPSLRLGLSGTPGVGKSTFIERFGLMLCEEGRRLAVLAVDPSSSRSGGSILGDKTRMEQLSRHPSAFIRPTPSASQLGGVARRTREVILLVEAAGFDTVIVETVGVGQSETLVAEMTDIFLLLLAPAGGDELQGVKRGIMEVADMILVNKADGDLIPTARRTTADYAGALRLLRHRPQDPEGFPKAAMLSAAEGSGMAEAWAEIVSLSDWRRQTGVLEETRARQTLSWFVEEIEAALALRVRQSRNTAGLRAELEADLLAGRTTPRAAAAALLDSLFAP
ncbi:methylmalonyl Co-A mutase-associated GTPase MeaB [Algicella marina]|uniref:methylmalonyl Co-A mutase-associated GTPase MeaB n=1 Tax=Algicella marina TaxID=2683284 RepID=UPI0024DF520A|nr:methylmalonyl Co-A mutase-associated GTPase MeaB [Algicella marina]